VLAEALVGGRHVVDRPVSEGAPRRIRILDHDGEASRVAWRVLPFQGRRDVAAFLAVALRDPLAVRKSRTRNAECHVVSPHFGAARHASGGPGLPLSGDSPATSGLIYSQARVSGHHFVRTRAAAVMSRFAIRPIRGADYGQWRPLWDGYNAFYGRSGATSLPEEITETTWKRFFDAAEPVHALVAEEEGGVVGLVHYLYHRSTTRLHDVCYLQDLFTVPRLRGLGVGRLLIHAVYDAARAAGCSRVYWQTQVTNHAGRALYDKVAEHRGFIVYAYELT